MRKGYLMAVAIVAALLAVIVLSWFLPSGNGQGIIRTASSSASDNVQSAVDAIVPPGGAWRYGDDVDAMTSGHIRTACVTSINAVRQDAPYEDVNADFCLRSQPRDGLNAYIRLQGDGQILCEGDGCRVPIRFESRAMQKFPAVGAADGATNIIFIERPANLLRQIKSARSMTVEIELYQNGNQPLIFQTTGLKWAAAPQAR